MSADGSDDGDEIPGREIAYRLFAAEYDDATLSYAESDEERAPNYVITPTGARLNRIFAVGTLTEVTSVNDEMVRARIVDPTGAFVVYAGQYQPDELATLEQLEPPAFVAVSGKARTFQPEDSDRVYTSIRPESIATVDADTRDRWVVSAAEQTLERIGTYAAAADSAEPRSANDRAAEPRDATGDALATALRESGVESGLADGIPLARDHYGTTPAYLAALRDCAREAVEVVAGERDQVGEFALRPDESSPAYESTFGSLADLGAVDVDATTVETDEEPDPAAVTAGEGEPESMSAATADEFSAAEDVPAEAADDDSSFDSAEASEDVTAEASAEDEPDSTLESDAPDSETETDAGSTDVDAAETESAESEPETGGETVEFDAAEPAEPTDTADETDELGDFDAGDTGMYEMDDEEREQLEAEFGAEFSTGAEVDEPGEADIDVPEPDAEPDADAETEPESQSTEDDLGEPPASTLEPDSPESVNETADEAEASDDEPEPEPDAESETGAADEETADEPADDVDLQSYVVETMEELDDGDGADRSTLVDRVASETGADGDDVEDAIEEALMGGQCYEPDDETLKAI
jgi:uncharacterized protein